MAADPDAYRRPSGPSIALLFAIATFTRSVLLTVVPLQALAYLGSAQRVSVLYLCVSLIAVAGNLGVPLLLRWLPRRAVYALGVVLQLGCVSLMATGQPVLFVCAMVSQVLGIACAEITLNLYLLDHIPRRELVRFEPLRVFYAGAGWAGGPWLGVWLQQNLAGVMPFAVSALGALVMFAYFRALRLGPRAAVAPRASPPASPLRHLRRFFSQPRLALAWILAIGRSSWWTVFYVYAPILLVRQGAPEETCAAIVSAGNAAVFLARVWGRLAARHGVRKVLLWGYGVTGALTLVVGLAPAVVWLLAVLLVASAIGASVIDGAGNVPFLRAVRPYERAEMLSVFMTYRDASQLVPPATFSALLHVMPLSSVFIVVAAWMLGLVHYARYLPRRL